MGMNYNMRHPKEDDKELRQKLRQEMRYTFLYRNYNAFASGPEATGENCEFYQIEKLYDIDLSPLRCYNYGGFGIYEENVESEFEWKLENAESDTEREQLKKRFAIKLEEAKHEDKDALENNWVATKIVKSTILNLIEKVEKQPELLNQIEYSMFFDKDSLDIRYKDCILRECFDKILEFITVIEKHGIYKMAFYEM